MTDDTLPAERLAPLVDTQAPDWGDVTRRVRRARRRRTLTTALVVVGVLVVAAPAFGLADRDRLAERRTSAPDRVQLDFAQLGVGAPKGVDPRIVPNAARKVTVVTLADRAAYPLGRADEERRLLRNLVGHVGRLPLASRTRGASRAGEPGVALMGSSA